MEILQQLDLFKDINHSIMEDVKNHSLIRHCKKDSVLFYEGDEPKFLHILINGILKIYKTNEKGSEIVLHFIQRDSFVAEIANLQNFPYPASASFESDGDVLLISQDFFRDVMLNNIEIMKCLLISISKKARSLEGVIANSMAMNSKTKIANFIINNRDILKQMKQKQIANILNTTPETLSRVLNDFKKFGFIKKIDGELEIIDMDGLQSYI